MSPRGKGLLFKFTFVRAARAVSGWTLAAFVLLLSLLASPNVLLAQQENDPVLRRDPVVPADLETTEDWNRRLEELLKGTQAASGDQAPPLAVQHEYRIGSDDMLQISVFEAPELSRSVRVTANGEIFLPLLGGVQAAGLTARELELVLEVLLRRTYMKDPHVGVFVSDVQSHPVSVFGAVRKPGVFQIRGPKTLIEVLSSAEGLAEDAGDTIVVTRGGSFQGLQALSARNSPGDAPGAEGASAEAGTPVAAGPAPGETFEVNIKSLLETGDPQHNVPIFPGDIVKVTRAGIVYVVGEVKKPGGFVLKNNEDITLLQAVALAEGPTSVSARSKTRIIRTDDSSGQRTEIPVDLEKILQGREPDPSLQPRDIVFVPGSAARKGFYRAAEAAVSIVSGVIIWRR